MKALLDGARSHGIPVFFTRYTAGPEVSHLGWFSPECGPPLRSCWPGVRREYADRDGLIEGHQVVDELAPRAGEVIVDKFGYGSFHNTGGEVRVRIGLHTSETTPVGHRYVDLGVHQVARICAGAHGGQVVMSEETVAAVADRLPPSSSLLALGAFHLRGFSEPVRLSQLRHPQLRENFPPLRAIGVVVHNLPFLRASFVGRDEEMSALLALLRTTGILTLVGLGGVGKTRLAVQLAQQVLGDFPDGAWLVELASLSDPAFVPRAVADAARVAEVPGRDIEDVLVETMVDKAALLVLDNCEHVIEAAAGLAERLSSHCPQLVILATSREPLDIEGEVVWRVQPLSTLDPRQVSSASDLVAVESVGLFVERARMSSPGFELTDENAADVARIVSHLNGIPLAIELAASTLSDQPLSGLLAGLDDRFALLTRGRRTAPERHQTLRAALEWSLDLLEEPERLLFSRLAAFAPGLTTEAVVGVCRGLPGADKDLASGLRRLARASLLIPQLRSPRALVDAGVGPGVGPNRTRGRGRDRCCRQAPSRLVCLSRRGGRAVPGAHRPGGRDARSGSRP